MARPKLDLKNITPAMVLKMNDEDAAEVARLVEAAEIKLRATIEPLRAIDPFWFYQPTDGTVTEDGYSLLKEYLNEEDIPQGKLDGQLDYHLSMAEIRGASGGNQSGKSLSGAIDCFIDGLGVLPMALQKIYPKEKLPKDSDYPRFFRYVTVDHTTFLNTVIPTFQKWVPRDFLIDGQWDKSYHEESKEGQRTLQLGKKGKLMCSIDFMTNEMKTSKFQGPPRHKIIYDEEPRYDIYRENLLRFVTSDRLDISFNFTPTNGLTWATDLFENGQDDKGRKVDLFKFCSVCNPMANMNTLRAILDKVTDYNELKMRLLGEFISLSGLVYGRLFNHKHHVIPPFFAKPEDYVVHLGLDPHLVTPTAGVFLALDRENNKYILDSYLEESDTEQVKADIHRIFKDNGWRWGFTVVDKSSNSDILAFGGLNIFKTLGKQPFAMKGMRTSEKYEGSIKSGVDEIKKALKLRQFLNAEKQVIAEKPTLFICDTPTNRILIQSFRTLERDTYANEDKQGPKDRIKEGKHHLHAAARYLFQFPLNWYPAVDQLPQLEYFDEASCW